MPRQQVYGKRSRAVYNNFAIFDSPQRPTVNSRSEEATQRLVEKVTGLCLNDYADGIASSRRRTALVEVDANTVVLPVPQPKTKRGARRKKAEVVVVEEVSVPVTATGTIHDELDGETLGRELVMQPDDEVVAKAEPEELLDLVSQAEALQISPALEADHTADQLYIQQKLTATSDHLTPAHIGATPDELTTIAPAPINNIYSHNARPLLETSSHDLTSFALWSSQLSDHFFLTKIAEASFGEVYRLSLLSPLPGLSRADESVFKIIALQAPVSTLPAAKKARAAAMKKQESMSKVEDVASEVRVLQRMSSIPGFTNFRDVRIVQGRPPSLFVDAFKAFNEEQKAKKKDLSHFPDPAKKSSYGEDQLWAVIEMQDAGTDLERLVEAAEGECTSIWSVWDIFWQVVLTLAKGEEGAEFEHRDLHLGNICVRHKHEHTLPKFPADIDASRKLGFTDLETTIIDYTISRCRLKSTSKGHSSDENGIEDTRIAHHDLLPDPSLFQGDSTEEYQYDIYRYMRGAVYSQDCLSTTATPSRTDIWRAYHPSTNLVWLHFLLYKLLEQLSWPSSQRPPARKVRGAVNPAFARWKRANDLEHTLLHVQNLLDPETGIGKNTLRSASDIVALALSEGWLGVEDVLACHEADGRGLGEDGEAIPSSPPATSAVAAAAVEVKGDDIVVEEQSIDPPLLTSEDAPTHIQINIDIMEEKGLEVATAEAWKTRRRERARRRRSTL